MSVYGDSSGRLLSDLLLNVLPDGMMILSGAVVVQANASCCELLGFPLTDLIGQNAESLFEAFPDLTAVEGDSLPPETGKSLALRVASGPKVGQILCLSLRLLAGEDCTTKQGCGQYIVSLRAASSLTAYLSEQLRESEAQYRSIFENAQEGIYQTTPDGRYLRVNPALARIYGYPSVNALMAGLTDIASQLYVDPHRRAVFLELMERNGVVHNFEAQIFRQDGSQIWITENARCVRDSSGQIRYYEGTVEDISDRRRREEEIRLLAKVFDSTAEGIAVLDTEGRVYAVNPAFAAVTGQDAAALTGQPLPLVADGLHERSYLTTILERVSQSGTYNGEIFATRRGGEVFPAELSVAPVRLPDGQISHFVLHVADITSRKSDEAYVRFHANYDMLTRLPNRRLVIERLEQALEKCLAEGRKGCVLFLDLDRFKVINDTYGHAVGDELLRMVAKRLRHCTKPDDTIGRLGGDEFLILMTDVAQDQDGIDMADKVLYSLSEPFSLLGTEQFCLPSIGISYFPDHGTTVSDVLRTADIAMYQSKKNAVRRYTIYDPSLSQATPELLSLENDLRLAAARGELELFYQPKVCAHSMDVQGAEALVRWRHPVMGMVSPAEFIPIAEETGLIVPIGRWVLRRACLQMVRWLRNGMDIPSVSVNVSVRQFQDPAFVVSVAQILEETDLPPSRLDLEITESVMSGDVTRAVAILHELKELGVTLSMDDFGTGYSSLNYLKTFPIDTLKIDQTFVRDAARNPKDAAIVTTIVTLAQNLGFSVVAEGVETLDHATLLREMGCNTFQGYWIAKPLPAADFSGFWNDRLTLKGK
ncbi:sensor domain-containing protein [Novispirillum itersonii]|uniref:sensor domain-containing protein n=1 Tax=Novispirillum itersonii TaxID=189 RepID=UPI0005C14B60|nr:bifunctional diguanylate cyclase/phosphodiesterase [Novispirillum itersonii]